VTEPSARTLEMEMAAIADAINLAAEAVEGGREADLATLGKRVDGLCMALLTLPATDARRIGAGLPAITDKLDGIAQILISRGVGAAQPAPDSPASRGQAARAYGAALSRDRR
jgi:hypothetical protein